MASEYVSRRNETECGGHNLPAGLQNGNVQEVGLLKEREVEGFLRRVIVKCALAVHRPLSALVVRDEPIENRRQFRRIHEMFKADFPQALQAVRFALRALQAVLFPQIGGNFGRVGDSYNGSGVFFHLADPG